jgi:hypothetical protein
MQKSTFLLTLSFIATIASLSITPVFAYPMTFKVLGVNGDVLFQRNFNSSEETLGQLSHTVLMQALADHGLKEYQGSESGLTSINEMGGEFEVLSDTEMNAYGWCYRVDGHTTINVRADEYLLTQKESLIEWYYAYAHLDKDQWKSMCVPAKHQPPKE